MTECEFLNNFTLKPNNMKLFKTSFAAVMLWLFCLHPMLMGQEISRSVVGNAGSYYQNVEFGNLHWTVGEVAVSRLQSETELGQGFHQSYYELFVKTTDAIPYDWEILVYPNPTADQLQVKIPSGEVVELQLFSTQGQLLLKEDKVQSETALSLDHLPAGIYWLRLFDPSGKQRSFQIQKIQY